MLCVWEREYSNIKICCTLLLQVCLPGGEACLAGGEPGGGQLGGDPEDEDLAGGDHCLPGEGDPPAGLAGPHHLEPGAGASAGRAQQHAQP